MVGKPNLLAESGIVQSARSKRRGLEQALDAERAASMADEGGTSGATMDAFDPPLAATSLLKRERRRARWIWFSLALAAAYSVAALAARRRR